MCKNFPPKCQITCEISNLIYLINGSKCGLQYIGESEVTGSNLWPGASCWKVGSYLPMPSGLQCSMHWFPPPVNYLSPYDPGC